MIQRGGDGGFAQRRRTLKLRHDPATTLELHDGDQPGVLRLIGELDGATAPFLKRRLDRAPRVKVLDLRDVTFMGSGGLRVLQAVAGQSDGNDLVLRAPSSPVRRILEVSGLAGAFIIEGHGPD